MNNNGQPVTITLDKNDKILDRFPYIKNSLLIPGFIAITDIKFYLSEYGVYYMAEVDAGGILIREEYDPCVGKPIVHFIQDGHEISNNYRRIPEEEKR